MLELKTTHSFIVTKLAQILHTVMSISLPSRLERLDEGRMILRGVVWAIVGRPHTLLSRLIGLMMCVTLEMARFMLRGVLVSENARLTRRPNLTTSHSNFRMPFKKTLCKPHGMAVKPSA